MSRHRPRFLKRLLRFIGFTLVALVTLIVLALTVVSFQGRREWAAVRRELLAKGEKLSRLELAPPPIPDDQNFFADAIWRPAETLPGGAPTKISPFQLQNTPLTSAELTALRQLWPNHPSLEQNSRRSSEVYHLALDLQALPLPQRPPIERYLLALAAPLSGVPEKIESLLRRPKARFPIDYGGFTWKIDPYPGMNEISSLLAGLALVDVSRGQATDAARLTQDLLRLTDTLAKDPILYAQMLRAGVLARALNVIHAGLANSLWSDSELASLQSSLGRIDLLPGIALAFRGERGFANQAFEALHRKTPDASELRPDAATLFPGLAHLGLGSLWLPSYLTIFGPGDQAEFNLSVQRIVDRVEQAPSQWFAVKPHRLPSSGLYRFTHAFTANFVFLLGGNVDVIGIQMTEVKQAIIVCALERYRLAKGEYPENLAALIPGLLPDLPRGPLTLQPMRYLRTSATSFRLWAAAPKPEMDISWIP